MRWLILVVVSMMLAVQSFSQETPPLAVDLARPGQPMAVEVFNLPEPLTVAKLYTLLLDTRKGTYDPMEVTQAIIKKGASAVPLLREILFVDSVLLGAERKRAVADSLQSPKVVDPTDPSAYIISSLEGIGTKECYDVLMQSAKEHRNPDVRGASLVALGNSYYERVVNGMFKADVEVIHVLLRCADDTTLVPRAEQEIASLARAAFRTWTGMEMGERGGDDGPITVGRDKTVMSLGQYREHWWGTKGPLLVWSKEEGRFVIRP